MNPHESPSASSWERVAARCSHTLLYALLFAMPLAGLLGSAASGYPLKFFGYPLALGLPKSMVLKTLCSFVHAWCSWVLLAAVCVHVAAAIKHALADRDDVWPRMWRLRGGGSPGTEPVSMHSRKAR